LLKILELIGEEDLDWRINLVLTSENVDEIMRLREKFGNKCDINIFYPSRYPEKFLYLVPKKKDIDLIDYKANDDKNKIVKTQKEWLEILKEENCKEILEYIGDGAIYSEKKKARFLFEHDRTLYDFHGIIHQFFEIGSVFLVDLRKTLEKGICSLGLYLFNRFLLNNFRQLADKWADISDERVYNLSNLLTNWSIKELENNFEFWFSKVDLRKLCIYPERTISYRYFSVINQIYLENEEKEILIEDPWAWVVDKMLSGYSTDKIIIELKRNFNKIPERELLADLKSLILSLYNTKVIRINFVGCYKNNDGKCN